MQIAGGAMRDLADQRQQLDDLVFRDRAVLCPE
jgi:hypothetical protein